MMPKVMNTQVLAAETMSLLRMFTHQHHQGYYRWSIYQQVLVAYKLGDGIVLKHTESIITLI